ncbi:MAG: helix-turn-helix domain-containing protein [Actinoplanes sp.]
MTIEAVGRTEAGLAGAVSAVLDAVTSEASTQAVDAALRRLHRAAGPLAGEPDMQALTATAHRAAGRAHSRHRREQSLLTLHQAAADLWRHHDLTELHDALVGTLGRLVPGVDAAWLSVRDDTGDWRGAAAWGLTWPAALKVLGRGQGLAAAAVRAAAPLVVDSYPDSTLFEHASDSDQVMRREGFGGVLAVPVTVNGEIGAVLHAARRDGLPFAPDDVAVVDRFARATAAQLGAVTVLAAGARRLADQERATTLVDTLLNLVTAAEMPGLPAAVRVLAAGLEAEIAVLDPHGRVLAATRPEPLSEIASTLARQAGVESGTVLRSAPGPGPVRYAVAIGAPDRPEGTVLVTRRTALPAAVAANLRRAAQALAALRMREHAVLRAYDELQGDLLGELLSARRPLPRSARALAAARRFALDRRYVTVTVDGDGLSDRTVAGAAGVLGGIGGRHDGVLVALLPGADPQRAAAELALRIRRTTGVAPRTCAADPIDPAAGGLADAFESARHGLQLLAAAGATERSATTGELALYRPLFDPDRAGEVHDFLEATLRPLVEYDREQRTDLVHTVRVFLAAGNNASQAARRLHIHLNTMIKRLERVSRLLGEDWQNGTGGLRLRLALHLQALTEPEPYVN